MTVKTKKEDENKPLTLGQAKSLFLTEERAREIFLTKEDFNQLVVQFSKFITRLIQLEERVSRIEEKMYTQEDHAKFMIYMDQCMKEVEASRRERKFYAIQMQRLDDRYRDHEERICVLEEK